MATGITTYQCPACTGPLHFVGESGRLECDYCGKSYDVTEIERLFSEKEAASIEAQEKAEAKQEKEKAAAEETGDSWDAQEAAGLRAYNCPSCGAELICDASAGLRAYNCPSCGAELICDATTAATSCPYCGNPTIVPGQFTGGLRPDLLIPFRLDKQAAINALKMYYRGKKFLPKAFSEQNHIEEIQGVYVPFWLCDCKVEGSIHYHATNISTWREGDYKVTETKHYQVDRSGGIEFRQIPVDASTKMPDAHMDAIEPYDYSDLRPFSSAYLPGFLADKYDVNQQESLPRIQSRAENSAEMEMRNTVKGYSTVTATSKNLNFSHSGMKYALMPVWMLSTKWKDQNFLFAMNGQTGKLVGDLPIDNGKRVAWFVGTAVVSLLLQLAFWWL